MPRQRTEIPWDILASNLGWSSSEPGTKEDLHLLLKPTQEEELSHFIKVFVRNVKNESESGYNPDEYCSEPAWEDIILTDDIVEKITPTVRRVLHDLEYYFKDSRYGCDTLIPREEREAFAFLRPHFEWYRCGEFWREEGSAMYNVEIVKILLIHGEMDAIFRVCPQQGFDFGRWWSVAECEQKDSDLGWDQICITTLLAYIGVNVLRRFPESWYSPSDVREYRDTRLYQYMLRSCTISDAASRVATHPHREFFGIAEGQFNKYRDSSGAAMKKHSNSSANGVLSSPASPVCEEPVEHHPGPPSYGVLPFSKFLVEHGPVDSLPSVSDVQELQSMLQRKLLPMELVLQIIDFPGYLPRRRLVVSHDPLHPWNRDLLEEHMDYCWQLLVRCDMTARGAGIDVKWEELVGACLSNILTEDGEEIISAGRGRTV